MRFVARRFFAYCNDFRLTLVGNVYLNTRLLVNLPSCLNDDGVAVFSGKCWDRKSRDIKSATVCYGPQVVGLNWD